MSFSKGFVAVVTWETSPSMIWMLLMGLVHLQRLVTSKLTCARGKIQLAMRLTGSVTVEGRHPWGQDPLLTTPLEREMVGLDRSCNIHLLQLR